MDVNPIAISSNYYCIVREDIEVTREKQKFVHNQIDYLSLGTMKKQRKVAIVSEKHTTPTPTKSQDVRYHSIVYARPICNEITQSSIHRQSAKSFSRKVQSHPSKSRPSHLSVRKSEEKKERECRKKCKNRSKRRGKPRRPKH